MNKTTKKKKKSFFKKIDYFTTDYWKVNCPECKKIGVFRAYLSEKKDRLYLKCDECQTIYISPKKIVKTT